MTPASQPARRVLWPPLVAMLAGGVAALGFPAVDQPLLALLGVGLMLGVARRAPSALLAITTGAAFGLGFFGMLLGWSLRFGAVAWAVLVSSQALFFAPIGFAAFRLRFRHLSFAAGVAATWVAMEALRARWPLGGFEWGQLGYVWHDASLRRIAGAVGVLGLTGLTVFTAAAVVALAATVRAGVGGQARRRLLLVVVPVLGVAALFPGGATTPAGRLRVAVVQIAPVCSGPSVDCPGEDLALLNAHVAGTRTVPDDVDLIVWGESAVGAADARTGGATLAGLLDLPAPLLTGVTSPAERGRFLNQNVLYSRDGQVQQFYLKRHPVPFGEYVPARALLGRIGDVGRLVPADMAPGAQPGVLTVGPWRLSTVSSFELSFAREVRAGGAAANAVTAITTESSYGRSAVSDQLLAIAQLRAVELGRSVLVAATTGRSAIIDPDGTIRARTGLLSPGVLVDDLVLATGSTPYARTGDLPVIALAVVAIAATGRRATRTGGATPRATGRGPRRARRR